MCCVLSLCVMCMVCGYVFGMCCSVDLLCLRGGLSLCIIYGNMVWDYIYDYVYHDVCMGLVFCNMYI